jgi:hypothetical protein
MSRDPKREVLRHMVATVGFRGKVAIRDAPQDFAHFRPATDVRSPGEILAHIGDLLEGSHYLLRGEFIELTSEPLPWDEEGERFFAAVTSLETFLASDAPLAHSVEKMVQGPVGDALTHIGQIIMLRRMVGVPIREEQYFTAEIGPGSL